MCNCTKHCFIIPLINMKLVNLQTVSEQQLVASLRDFENSCVLIFQQSTTEPPTASTLILRAKCLL